MTRIGINKHNLCVCVCVLCVCCVVVYKSEINQDLESYMPRIFKTWEQKMYFPMSFICYLTFEWKLVII